VRHPLMLAVRSAFQPWGAASGVQRTGPERLRAWIPAIAAAALYLLIILFQHGAATYSGVTLIFSGTVPLCAAAVAEMFVISLGDIDVGIGYFIGVCNAVAAKFLVGSPVVGVFVLAGLVAAYSMLGALIEIGKMPSILATLGASFIWLGVGLAIYPTPGGAAPTWLLTIYGSNPPFVPFPILALIGLALPAAWYVRRTRGGILLRAMGSNRAAAVGAGISPLRRRIMCYALAGVFGVIGGLAVTALADSGAPSSSGSLTLLAIAAVVLGGGEFSGGIASASGAVLGAVAVELAITFSPHQRFVQLSGRGRGHHSS